MLSLCNVNFYEVSLAQTFAVGDVICASCRTKAHRKGVAKAEYHTTVIPPPMMKVETLAFLWHYKLPVRKSM